MNKKENQRVHLTKRLLKEQLIEILKMKGYHQCGFPDLFHFAGFCIFPVIMTE